MDFLFSQRWCSVLLGLAVVSCTGCQTASQTPATPVAEKTGHSGSGYALLFKLMDDERNVSKLLLVKRERAELNELVKAISRTAGDAYKEMEAFGKADPSLNLKVDGLPPAEVAARASISKATAWELLTDKGKDFELALLLTQEEALTYGEHLAVTVGVKEANGPREQFLRKLATDLAALRLRVKAMLAAHYTWDGK
ncbi:MAG: hypothetical protein JWM16_28 [Verrucomicrobiales bacterium]|nr:hypothetical protein [Verrucomicrobiales bacterium]